MITSRRLAAAMSALAMVAGGMVSAAVINATPAFADHCDPAGHPEQRAQDQPPQGDQNQPPQDAQDQPSQGDQNQPPQGGGALVSPSDPGDDPQSTADPQDPAGPRGTGARNSDPRASRDPGTPGDQGAPRDPRASQEPGEARSPQNPGNPQSPGDPRNPDDRQNPGDPQNPGDRQNPGDPRNPGRPEAEPTGSGQQGDDRRARPTRSPSPSPSPSATQDDDCADLGPFVADFVDIRTVQPGGNLLAGLRSGSRGTFVSQCGTNGNRHNNPDNFIVAPGVSNGAHHLHDYVGNLSTDAFSTDQSLAAAGTTCRLSDRSTYFWPVLRNRKVDANLGDPDGNVGQVLRPRQAVMQFRGNAAGRVSEMPRFLRMITGDAKAATNGGANARAAWTCTGFTNRVTTKYPLCPRGSLVVRVLDFPSCWDGQNTDSANHRTHVVFPGQDGGCPQGTRAIPQLRMILTYSVPQGPSYALDAFPEQLHNPVTDHADFANVMPDRLMSFVVGCINRGRRC
ncbi:DUF1996 domain-containing protein [Nonomuraea dietziae]|uniref:DUF1996 domain-containing protein n=1 Tax=Nonomuraea dietziae TaxID=65515 RepID=UPI0034146D1B